MDRIDCETCGGYGVREVETVEGGVADVFCAPCRGMGGFDVYGPLTREQAERRGDTAAAWQTFSDALVKHECTHCDRQGFDSVPQPPSPCWACGEGIVIPLRDLQAVARPALPWRREGDKIIATSKPVITLRHVDKDGRPVDAETIGALLDEIVASGASFHLETMSDFDPAEGQDAAWWMEVRVGDETVHVNLGAAAPIWTRVDRWTESPKPDECDPSKEPTDG